MIHTEKRDGITIITIDRPERKNAIDRETAFQLEQACLQFDTDTDSPVAILTGAGDTFCAGADLKEIASGNPNPLSSTGTAPLGPSRLLLSKPIIAAISGHAVAGGLELALWCDLRIMEEDAIVGVFCRRWGVPLIDGGTIRLPRLIGLSRALDLILTGREVSAQEALHIGLANRVVPKGSVQEEAFALAKQIASFPQIALVNDRRSAYEQFSHDLPSALVQEFEYGMNAIASMETQKGAQNFVSTKHAQKKDS